MEIAPLLQEWMKHKEEDASYSVKDFIIENYIEKQVAKSRSKEEAEREIDERLCAWEENMAGFERFVLNLPYSPELTEWQAAQMLNNVIEELDLDNEDAYRYLANVKKMIYDRMLLVLPKETASSCKENVKREYDAAWEKADGEVAKSEVDALFAETTFLMGYVGMHYEEETQSLLAQLALGQSQQEVGSLQGQAQSDLCFLVSYITMEVLEEDETHSLAEQQQFLNCAVPVYTRAQAYINEGENATHIMKMAQSYIGKISIQHNILVPADSGLLGLTVKVVWKLVVELLHWTVKVSVSLLSSLCERLSQMLPPEELPTKVWNWEQSQVREKVKVIEIEGEEEVEELGEIQEETGNGHG